jgi:hypothetical protein
VVIIRCALVGGTGPSDPLRVDLPTYSMVADDPTNRRAFVDVPDVDVPADVAAFVRANPTPDLIAPLPSSFPASLAGAWREHFARRYDLGQARWSPVVA